ncbi:MAG: alkaline phosphatase, partial [Oscillospiraceae bacterium]|nr:alkaline phosphatase [Oscillospiraceae bacterium]
LTVSVCACSAGTPNDNSTLTNATVDNSQPTTLESDKLSWVDYKEYNLDETGPVNNIILMIGDGMGENIIKATEIVKGDKLVMSGLKYKTYVTTYSQSVTEGDAEFTDSAASATAISTGVKTYNGCIGVDKNGKNLETICEYAQKCGMKTGLVDRHYVCHATPAGMAAHNEMRSNYKSILKDMIASHIDVMLGGGNQFYTSTVKELIAEHNYSYVDTEEDLMKLSAADGKVLGLFAYDNMKNPEYAPSLTTSTIKALELLENDNGFFLMVEGSNIDVCEAEQDMEGSISQVEAFDHTIDYVMSWAESHPGTLVIVTADHETGGVELPENATKDDINNDCFTSDGEHTNTNVLLMADGAQSAGICRKKLIDNTDIAKYMRKVLAYKK